MTAQRAFRSDRRGAGGVLGGGEVSRKAFASFVDAKEGFGSLSKEQCLVFGYINKIYTSK